MQNLKKLERKIELRRNEDDAIKNLLRTTYADMKTSKKKKVAAKKRSRPVKRDWLHSQLNEFFYPGSLVKQPFLAESDVMNEVQFHKISQILQLKIDREIPMEVRILCSKFKKFHSKWEVIGHFDRCWNFSGTNLG